MRIVTFVVGPVYDGKKLCAFLRGEAQISYALYATLRHIPDAVTRSGSPVRSIDRVHTGEMIRVAFPAEQTKLTPTPMDLHVLYEDGDLLVLNKSGFLAMHPSHGHQTDTLANGVTDYLRKSGFEGVFHAVGRLDKGTSGVTLCAKHAYAASRMNGQTEKTYLALVDRELSGTGTVDAGIYLLNEKTQWILGVYNKPQKLKEGENVIEREFTVPEEARGKTPATARFSFLVSGKTEAVFSDFKVEKVK